MNVLIGLMESSSPTSTQLRPYYTAYVCTIMGDHDYNQLVSNDSGLIIRDNNMHGTIPITFKYYDCNKGLVTFLQQLWAYYA